MSIALAGAFFLRNIWALLHSQNARTEKHITITSFDFILTNTLLLISLTVAQNEDVMEQFLKENITAGRIFILHFFTYIQNYFEWPVLNISCFLV